MVGCTYTENAKKTTIGNLLIRLFLNIVTYISQIELRLWKNIFRY